MAEPPPHGTNGRAGHGPDGGRLVDRRSQENTDALILMQARCLDQLLQVLPTLGGKQPRRLESNMSGEDRAMLQRVAAELLALSGAGEDEEDEGNEAVTGGARKRHKGLSWASPGSSTSMSLRGGRGRGQEESIPQVAGRRARMRVAEEFEEGGGADGSAFEDGMSVFPDPIWQHIFSFLPAKDLFPVMCTSSAFRALTRAFDPYYRHWNLRAAETKQCPGPYIERQRHINAKMRAILLDWLTDVHQSLNFKPGTYYRTAYILDQFLLKTDNVSREKLQLVGVTAFMVSAKLLEKNAPEPDDCAYWTDNAYSGTEVGAMEQRVAKVYRSDVLAPTAFDFLQLYLKEARLGKLAACRAHYYCERAVQEHGMLKHSPSRMAAASLLLAYKAGTPTGPAWPAHLAKFSGYEAQDLMPCAQQMCRHVVETVTTLSGRRLDAIKRKYSAGVYLAVSKMEPPVIEEAGH